MPVKKRSEILKYTVTTSGEPYQDAEGDWVYPDPVAVEIELSCRSEANSAGKPLVLEDGTFINYAFVIYLDFGTTEIPYGTPVSIFQGARRIGGGTVKRFHPWQRTVQVWV